MADQLRDEDRAAVAQRLRADDERIGALAKKWSPEQAALMSALANLWNMAAYVHRELRPIFEEAIMALSACLKLPVDEANHPDHPTPMSRRDFLRDILELARGRIHEKPGAGDLRVIEHEEVERVKKDPKNLN